MDKNLIYKKFPNTVHCFVYLEDLVWGGVPTCPYCKSKKSTILAKEVRHHCNSCNTSYSVTVGTIFYKTKIDLQKWFLAIYYLLDSRDFISAQKLSELIKVNKNTAQFIIVRIRRAISDDGLLLNDIYEAMLKLEGLKKK